MAMYDSNNAIFGENCYGGIKVEEKDINKHINKKLKNRLKKEGFNENCFKIHTIDNISEGNVLRVKRWDTHSKIFYRVENITHHANIDNIKIFNIEVSPFDKDLNNIDLSYSMFEQRNPSGGFLRDTSSSYNLNKNKATIISDMILADIFNLENEEEFISRLI